MNLIKRLFKKSESKVSKEALEQPTTLSLDDSFVHHFIKRGGKFLYCLNQEDITKNLLNIVKENEWSNLALKNDDLKKFTSSLPVKTTNSILESNPLFTSCEFLIAENGSILFSSIQIEDKRLSSLTNDFIVFATTSQIVKSKDESLTGIKLKYQNQLPTNISPIKNYGIDIEEDNFMNYGTCNSKNLYLLLLEDL